MRLLPHLLAALAFMAAAPVLTLPASAAGRGDVYSVSDVAVDVTTQDAAKAREQGFAQAHELAFSRLVKRLTLPDELARVGAPVLDAAALDQLVSSVDIQDERRSGVRYLGRFAVAFDPSGVRKTLRDKGLSVVDTRTAPILVVPVVVGGTPDLAPAWRQAWEQGGFAEELVPVSVAPATVTGAPDWTAAQPAAAAAGATSALYVTAQVSGQTLSVSMVEVAANNARRDRGTFTTPLPPAAAVLPTFQALAAAANEKVQTEWKLHLAAGAGQRERLTASVRFQTQAEWLVVKHALVQASSTLVSDIQTEAVSKDGAVVSFSHLGTNDQLAAELGRYGVTIEQTPQGVTLRPTPPKT